MPTRIGITGHQALADEMTWNWARAAIEEIVRGLPQPVEAISSLARGADQEFAEIVLNAGGTLYAVIPFPGYERTLSAEHLTRYHQLVARGRRETGTSAASDEEAFWAAGKRVVDLSTLLIAVWNGKPARGLGGTADVVRYAIDCGKPVVHLHTDNRAVIRLVL